MGQDSNLKASVKEPEAEENAGDEEGSGAAAQQSQQSNEGENKCGSESSNGFVEELKQESIVLSVNENIVAVPDPESKEDNEDDENDEDELNELESRQIPDEGQVCNAKMEVKHKLEISQQLFQVAGSMKNKKLIFQSK